MTVTMDFEIHDGAGEADGGFLFVWSGSNPEYSGDTWHRSLNEALEEARDCFGLDPSDWGVP